MELMDLQKAGLILSGAIYVGSVLWLWRGLSGRPSPVLVSDQPSVSAIVAARDEEADFAILLGRTRPAGLSGGV